MRAALALALSAILALAACGDDADSRDAEDYADTPVEDILEDMTDAMADVESVRMSGTLVDDGQEMELEVTANASGDCEGSMGWPGQGSFDLIQIDGVSYFKADEEFWREQVGDGAEQFLVMVGDKWVTNSSDPDGFGELCDIDELLEPVEEDLDNLSVEGAAEVDGIEAVKLLVERDDGEREGFAFIAADQPHRILRLDWADQGQVDFSDYDSGFSVAKPPADEIFDLGSTG